MKRPALYLTLLAYSLPCLLLLPTTGLAQDEAQETAPETVQAPAPAAPAQPQAPTAPEDMTPPADAETTGSGLAYQVLQEGTGANQPDDNDLVMVHYTGWKAEDGTVFDSSVVRGQPALLPIEALIEGWTEGLQLMTEGAKWRLWIPGNLAYEGVEGRPQGTLVFDVELLEVRKIPPVPEHLEKPAPDAEVAQSGLAWKVLKQGTGEGNPSPGDTVQVHYIGWNTEGQWFDSTYSKGQPAKLEFNSLIDGWKLALQDMVPGEKRRLWIPDRLAYRGEAGKPRGPLTFDVELIAINPEG